jgi:NADH dehydrogenase/NADH:ubiquinone oxidoreductase subunit G
MSANTYEEKKQARIQRLRDRAEKKRAIGKSLLDSAKRTSNMIPMGQPILMGHHSEKRHRRDLGRIHSQTDKGLDLLEDARRLEDRADNAENNTAISSDDNEAIEKLQDKLAKLEKKRQEIKDYNKKAKKEGKEKAPSYLLGNLSQNIRSVKKRIEQLEKNSKIENTEELINGVSLVVNTDCNRVQLIFDGKPAKEIMEKLKLHGFKWAPSVGAWQRMLSDQAIRIAEDLLKSLKNQPVKVF